MLSAEIVIRVAFCFFPREDNDLPAFVGKSLEHYASLRDAYPVLWRGYNA